MKDFQSNKMVTCQAKKQQLLLYDLFFFFLIHQSHSHLLLFFPVQILFIFELVLFYFFSAQFQCKTIECEKLNDCHKNDIFTLTKCVYVVGDWLYNTPRCAETSTFAYCSNLHVYLFKSFGSLLRFFFFFFTVCLNFQPIFICFLTNLRNKDVEFQF